MATPRSGSTSFWQQLRSGPWGKPVAERIESALDMVVRRLRGQEAVRAVVVFGSYARGEFGRKSDLDVLVLIDTRGEDQSRVRETVIGMISEAESELRLPIHISPLVAETGDAAALGAALLHELWTDGVILYGEASALAMLRVADLAPWHVVRFSLAGTMPKDRVRLARRLHGTPKKSGIIQLPGINLARGAALVPAGQSRQVRDSLDEAGAKYDIVPVWREV